MLLTVIFAGVSVFATDLYKSGYDNGYNDGLHAVQYFVSPTEGQPGQWVVGYKQGLKKGEIDRINQVSQQNKLSSFNRKLTGIVDLFKAVNFTGNEVDLEQYMADSENLFEEIRMNIENDDIDQGIEKGTLLRMYASYASDMDSYDRTSFSPLNRKLVEYLNYRLQVVTDHGSKLEMKYYSDLLKLIVDMISK